MSLREEFEKKLIDMYSIIDRPKNVSELKKDMEKEGLRWLLKEYIDCVNDSDAITEKIK